LRAADGTGTGEEAVLQRGKLSGLVVDGIKDAENEGALRNARPTGLVDYPPEFVPAVRGAEIGLGSLDGIDVGLEFGKSCFSMMFSFGRDAECPESGECARTIRCGTETTEAQSMLRLLTCKISEEGRLNVSGFRGTTAHS
jgi:hypothetical protein